MKTKTLFYITLGIMITIVISLNVNAVLTDNLFRYYKLDNNYIDNANLYNGSASGSPSFINGKINQGINLLSVSSQLITIDNVNFNLNSSNFTYNLWINTTSTDASPCSSGDVADALIGQNVGGQHQFGLCNGKVNYQYYDTSWKSVTSSLSVNNGNLHMISLVFEISSGITAKIYIDGINTENLSLINNAQKSYIGFQEIGSGTGTTGYFNGLIDEVGIWKGKALTSSEISELYNSGLGYSYPFITNITNFTITNYNNYNSQSILNFSALISETTYNTTTGTITTPYLSNYTGLLNITIFSNNMFNKTYTNQNISSNLIATQNQYPIIYLNNKWNNSNISSYNITIDSVNYGTNTTFIYLPFNTTKTIDTYANDYFNTTNSLTILENTINKINVSKSIINFSLFEFDNNISINNFTLNISGYGIPSGCNTTGSSCLLYPNNNIYTFNVIDNTGVNTFTLINNTFSVNNLDNKTINAYVTFHWINVTAFNILSNASISNFSINLSDLTDGTDNRFFNTTNGSMLIPVIHHNYSLIIDGYNFALFNNTANVNINTSITSNSIVNQKFYLYSTNSINLSFFDSTTLAQIFQNITINFIGGTTQTNITNTSSIYVDLFTPSDYTIKSTSDDYRVNTYILALNNRSFNYIPIYLEKINTTYLVLMNIKDKFSKDPIKNAKVTIQKFTNNAWVTDQIYNTDFNGQAEAYFILSTQYYNFIVEYDGVTYFGVLNNNEDKKIIYSEDVTNGITIEIDLNPTTTILNYNNIYNNVFTEIEYQNESNVSGYFIFRWNDLNGYARNGSLNIYDGNTLNCSTSAYSSSGSINCFIINNNSLKIYNAIGKIDGIPRNAMYKQIGGDNAFNFDWGIGGWIIALFLVIIGFTAFAQIPALSLWFGTGIFCLTIFLGLIFKNIDLTIFGLILFIAFILGKIRSESGVNS